MAKKSITLGMLVLAAFISSVFAEVKTIPGGKPVTVDGRAAVGEWNDAESVEVIYKNIGKLVISIKHDGQNLNILYQFKMGDKKTVCIPELYIDTLANGGQTWQADDWWFHVSGNNCMSQGNPDDHSRIQRDLSDWQAAPTLKDSKFRSYFEIEMSIPLN